MAYTPTADFETRMTNLAGSAPSICTKAAFPNATVSEGIGPTTYSYLTIAKGGGTRPTLLIVAGMHAREWAQPDAAMSFAEKLVTTATGTAPFTIPAYTDATGGTHGPITVANAQIKRMVDELTIIIVPVANPDGRAFSEANAANKGWRKNRAPRAVAADPFTVGVDINRNFDIAWDFEVYFSPAFVATGAISASKDPADPGQRYIGPAAAGPASQPEVKNLVWLLVNKPITYCIDLHSYSELVMYPWGIEKNGSDPAQTFRVSSFDRTRDGHLSNAYSEYFPNISPLRLLDRHDTIAQSMRDGVKAATGRTYTVGQIATTVYPATGSLSDYAFSRQFTVSGSPPIYSFAIEFGTSADNFQPDPKSPHGYDKIEREVHAVLLRYLEAALPAKTASGDDTCPFSIAVVWIAAGAQWLDAIRALRETLLARASTRGPMLAINRLYRSAGRRWGPAIARRRWLQAAIAYGMVAPVAAVSTLANRGLAR